MIIQLIQVYFLQNQFTLNIIMEYSLIIGKHLITI